MSVPRGKKFVGRASSARIAFQDSSEDVRSFYTLGQMLKERKAATKHLNNVGRGVYVLVSALWESYCENLALEAAQALVQYASTPEELPPALARRIARELRADKHELSPWKLAGDGWRELTLLRVPQIARNTIFNTPKPDQVDDLFEKSIGLVALSSSWTPVHGSSEDDVREALRQYIELRGAIAHGDRDGTPMTKSQLSEFFQTVQHLVGQTEVVVANYLHERTGLPNWQRIGLEEEKGDGEKVIERSLEPSV